MGKLIEPESIISLDIIERNRELIVPYIFTNNQFNILRKRINGKKLDNNEKYYYYTSISKKMRAINALANIQENILVNGEEFIIKQRKEQAKKILKKFSRNHKNKNMFITGSFLYKKEYNDIDIFIFSKYEKEDYKEGNIHVNYLPPEAKDSLFFKSASKICISNFKIDSVNVKEDVTVENLITTYQELIIYILKKNDFKKELRTFILECYYLTENIVLTSSELNKLADRYKKSKNLLNLISKLMVHTLINQDIQTKIKKLLKEYIQLNEEAKKETKYFKNLDVYIKTYKEALEIGA